MSLIWGANGLSSWVCCGASPKKKKTTLKILNKVNFWAK
jgi:hypothetical protein